MKKSELNVQDTRDLQKAVAREMGKKDDDEKFNELLAESGDCEECVEKPGEVI